MSRLLKIFIFTLPLACSNLPEFFGLSDIIRIHGNYEFFKVLYFNIFSSIIILLFGLGVLLGKYNIKTNKRLIIALWLFFLINIISTLVSVYQMESFLGGVNKGHGMLFFNNTIGLLIIFLSLSKNIIHSLIKTFLYSMFFVALIGIWQFLVPSFDYGNLSNRAISTLGHPNYLAGLLLLSIPLLLSGNYIKNDFIRYTIKFFILTCLVITKSWWAIIILIFWCIFRYTKRKFHSYLIAGGLIVIPLGLIAFLFPEKLHSFVSRFYIWETTLYIMLSDTLKILSGFGSETLGIYFDSFKSPELYIFENFGFTADRPHNIILNFFYHFGIIGLWIIASIYYFIFKKTHGKIGSALCLISIFLLFNYPSVSTYVIILLLLSTQIKHHDKKYILKSTRVLFLLILFFSCSTLYYSSKLYLAERSSYTTDTYNRAYEILPIYPKYAWQNDIFTTKIHSEEYYLEKLYSQRYYEQNCSDLVSYFPSAENYIFCGGIFEQAGWQDLSTSYYQKAIEKLPDIWNKDSIYWQNQITKKTISGNRFYSEKYGNIGRILKKLNIDY